MMHKLGRPETVVKYRGKNYTLSELSNSDSVTAGLIWSRIYRGWSVEKAVETPSQAANHRYKYKGAEYRLFELAELSGLSSQIIRSRICDCNWPVERAVETPVRKRK